MKEIGDIFRKHDADGNGELDLDEFKTFWKEAISTEWTDETEQEAIEVFYTGGDANIDGLMQWNGTTFFLSNI